MYDVLNIGLSLQFLFSRSTISSSIVTEVLFGLRMQGTGKSKAVCKRTFRILMYRAFFSS